MGSRGLPAKGVSTAWKLNKDNVQNYNMTIKLANKPDSVTQEEYDEAIKYIDRSLATINRLNNEIFGLTTTNVPSIKLLYGTAKRNGALGTMDYDAYNDQVTIWLHVRGLLHSPDTAAHEYVHALSAYWSTVNYPDAMDKRGNAWHDMQFENRVVANALVKVGAIKASERGDMSKVFPAWQKFAGTIHRSAGDSYALHNVRETLTTSTQMVLRYGEKASPYAKAIVKELRKETRAMQRKMSALKRAERKAEKEREERYNRIMGKKYKKSSKVR